MKRRLLVAVPLLSAVVVLAWMFRPRHEYLGSAYVSDRSVTLWSSIAQVREPIDTLHYGDRLDVIARHNDSVKVRTVTGRVGWVDSRMLLEPGLWQRSARLFASAQLLPVQARGRTKVQTNLRVEPGRGAPRLYQFGRGFPVEVVGRAVMDWVQVSDERESAGAPQEAKKEDWFLVRAVTTRPLGEVSARSPEPTTTQPGDQSIPIAGWVVSRFIELDLPGPLREATASANLRPIAWFELNRVSSPAGDVPQYLVAGTRGPEGKPCDFTMLRVYTWNRTRARYETAFIANNLCGQLPIRVDKNSTDEPKFRFPVMGQSDQERSCRLIQTVVRCVREKDQADGKSAHSTAPQGGGKESLPGESENDAAYQRGGSSRRSQHAHRY